MRGGVEGRGAAAVTRDFPAQARQLRLAGLQRRRRVFAAFPSESKQVGKRADSCSLLGSWRRSRALAAATAAGAAAAAAASPLQRLGIGEGAGEGRARAGERAGGVPLLALSLRGGSCPRARGGGSRWLAL